MTKNKLQITRDSANLGFEIQCRLVKALPNKFYWNLLVKLIHRKMLMSLRLAQHSASGQRSDSSC
jgi:hypothetical protein